MRKDLKTFNGAKFDVVVIGAGINGASSAQHLSAAGYSVLLVDKGDFASGSSGRSTRMLHCGLRYFETPRPVIDFGRNPGKLADAWRMAKAAMEMRGELVKDSATRLRPIRMCFPIFRNGPYKPWQFDLAFKILGSFGPKDVPLDYQRVPAKAARTLPFVAQLPNTGQLHSVALFNEYMFDWPERFCIDAVLDAERMGASVRNYTAARLVNRDDRGHWRVSLTDELAQGETAIVSAPVVLNMTGIWIDQVNNIQQANRKRLVFGTKGAHIVVQLPKEFEDYGMATLNSIGEPHYCLPSQGGRHHIGPTETVYGGDIDNITVDVEDVAFLVQETNAVLPGLNIIQADVVYSWAGVRPLAFDPAHPKGKRSREIHDLASQGLPGVYAMTAGPIMTHRSAGREMTEVVRRVLPQSRPEKLLNYTPRQFPGEQNSSPLLDDDPEVKLADLVHAAHTEHAVNLADILIARTGVVYRHKLTDDQVIRAALAVAAELGWDQQAIDRQVADARSKIADLYQYHLI